MWFIQPERNYTGNYTVGNQNFTLLVLPTLRVSVEIVEIDYARWVLRCAHNGRPEAKVTWTVGGKYGDFRIADNNTIIVHPDCWVSFNLVASQMGLRCSVHDGPWSGHSLWVHGLHEQKLVPYTKFLDGHRHPEMGTNGHEKPVWEGEEPTPRQYPEPGY